MSVNVSRDLCYSIRCKGIENSRTPYAVAYAYVISIRILGNAAFLDQELWLMNWSFFYAFLTKATEVILMPWKPKSICNFPGCQTLTHDRYCEKHKKEMIKVQNDRSSKMYTYQWRKLSKEFLKKHPLCILCEREGRLTPATEVDHIKPHGGDRKLFWNKKNWQPLCKSCHSKKTAIEDGGFGNALKLPRG